MLEGIKVLCHSSIKIEKDKVIYIDPFKIDTRYEDADIIFITHSHYDHYSKEDIDLVKKENAKIVAPKSLKELLLNNFKEEYITIVEPNKEYIVDNIKFKTIPAYNINKQFHPKENEWVGYIIEINNIKYYIAGDTDITNENQQVECDVAFVPVGGTYTMDYKEAAQLINKIRPKIAIPIHYGSIVGSKEDAIAFSKLLDEEIGSKILIGEINEK